MSSEDTNYYWLKTPEEKKQAIDTLLSCFDGRSIETQESAETVIERIMEDEELDSVDKILRELKTICASIWQDDILAPDAWESTYEFALRKLVDIGKGTPAISAISDGSIEAARDTDFNLAFKANGKLYRTVLRQGRWIDYNFLRPFVEAMQDAELDGKYYRVGSETMAEGSAFIYADPNEYSKIKATGVLDLYELDEDLIDSVAGPPAGRPSPVPPAENHAASIPAESPAKLQPSIPQAAVQRTLRDEVNPVGVIVGILMIVFALYFGSRHLGSAVQDVMTPEPVRFDKPKSPEIRARERDFARRIIGDPTRIDEEKFNYLDGINTIAQERFLRFYLLFLVPEDDPEFAPIQAFSPDGTIEIRTPQQFKTYAKTYFPKSQDIFED